MQIVKPFYAALFPVILTMPVVCAQPNSKPYQAALNSVVEVIARNCGTGDRQGSGFLWLEQKSVVTALHVVSGCKSVAVRYRTMGEFVVLRTRIDQSRDLAELELQDGIPAAPLSKTASIISIGERLYVVGYPFSINTPDALAVEVTPATNDKGTLRDFLPRGIHASAANIGLSLDTRIVRTQPGVHPGASGAAVVNGRGELVGFGHGRLSATVGAIGWITLSDYLPTLRMQPWRSISNLPDVSASYLSGEVLARTMSATDSDSVVCGDLSLRYRWRRTLAEILRTHNDPVGIRELTKGAAAIGVDLDDLLFRVWFEDATGAYVAIPADWQFSTVSGRCVARGRVPDTAGTLRIVGRVVTGSANAYGELDELQRQNEDKSDQGVKMTGNPRIFGNERETLTNAAIINRRTYQTRAPSPSHGATMLQTGFVRGRSVLAVLGTMPLTVNDAFSYMLCQHRKWEGEDCQKTKERTVETGKALLSTALSTVPDS